jgi:hypothetical protein
MSCVAMLLISPVAWTHYFMMTLPATLAVPLWLAMRGRRTLAWTLAVVPVLLVWSHYLAKGWVGPVGLLGLGTDAWFLTAGVALAAERLLPARRTELPATHTTSHSPVPRPHLSRPSQHRPLDAPGTRSFRVCRKATGDCTQSSEPPPESSAGRAGGVG